MEMRFFWFHTLVGEDIAFNADQIALVCKTKKGTRIFLQDGSFYDVQEEFTAVLTCLNTFVSNLKN